MRKTPWLLAAILIGLCGCASRPQDLILGKWQNTDSKGRIQSFEFDKDATVRFSEVRIKNVLIPGKYKWIGDDQVEIEYTVPIFNVIKVEKFKIEVKRDDLAATDDGGRKHEFKRVK